MKRVDEDVLMLAGWFKAAYIEACAKVGAVAALLDGGVQEMRRLYIAARTRASAWA